MGGNFSELPHEAPEEAQGSRLTRAGPSQAAVVATYTHWSQNHTEQQDIFVGLTLPAGMCLVDTGAQHAVVGQKAFDRHVKYIKEHYDLKPKQVKTLDVKACGIGGATSFLSSWCMPTGMGGSNYYFMCMLSTQTYLCCYQSSSCTEAEWFSTYPKELSTGRISAQCLPCVSSVTERI